MSLYRTDHNTGSFKNGVITFFSLEDSTANSLSSWRRSLHGSKGKTISNLAGIGLNTHEMILFDDYAVGPKSTVDSFVLVVPHEMADSLGNR